MKPVMPQLAGLLALAACGAALAQAAPRQPHKQFPLAPPPAWVSPATPQGGGRYPAVMEADPGLPGHTVYRPADLAALGGRKLPVVAFGNGACVNVGNRFRYFLTEIASHGFLAIATGPISAREAESAVSSSLYRAAPAAGSPASKVAGPIPEDNRRPADTSANQLRDAIDWAIAEDKRKGGRYEGRIDTGKIAVMGQSCGGLQAIDAARDPRVTTLGVWNSGAFAEDGKSRVMAGARADKADLAALHGSAIYVTGEPADVAFGNADDDVARLAIPVFRAWRENTGHQGTYREPGGGAFGQVAVAWLQWQLQGDPEAARQFVGPDCGLCKRPEWHVKNDKLTLDSGKVVSQ